MILDHVAIWTDQIEKLKEYYVKYFNGSSNHKYHNPARNFESYFISFGSGSRIELMQMPGVPQDLNDNVVKQHQGIIHLSFGMESMDQVDAKMKELQADGFRILRGPRKTGDGYYEFETLDPDDNRIEVCTIYKE